MVSNYNEKTTLHPSLFLSFSALSTHFKTLIIAWIDCGCCFFPLLLKMSFAFVSAHGRRLALRFSTVQTCPLHTENLCWNYCVKLMCFEC